MHVAIMAVQLGATGAGLVAAYLWWQSSTVEIPAVSSISGYVYEGHPDLSSDGISEMAAALRAQSHGSAKAAIWTGMSVLLQAIAVALQISN